MKPIPNPRDLAELRGLKFDDSEELRIPFQISKGGPLSQALVKNGRARSMTPADQANQPWYIRFKRLDGSYTWLRCGDATDLAGALAKAVLTLQELARGDKSRFDRYLSAVQDRASLTIGTLATEWSNLRYPTPDGQPRSAAEQRGIVQFLEIARRWWDAVGVSTINRRTWDEYVSDRRAQVAERFASVATGDHRRPPPSGDRSIDLERNALRCLCAWALATERIPSNPFATFPRARTATAVVSCNQQMPATDDEFHLISRHLIGDGSPTPQLVAGAQLLLQGLTGLRPGEPGALRWDAQSGSQRHQPGYQHQVTLGGETKARLAVEREKGGMTPYVAIHSALAAFLTAWQSYHQAHWPQSPWWFPAPWDPTAPMVPFGRSGESRLSRYVADAVEQLRLPYRRAHAWRAYYVRVRRSLDVSDGQIADELGERTGESIIRNTYGDPDGIRGDGQFDWLPSTGKPAWDNFAPRSPAVIQFPAAAA